MRLAILAIGQVDRLEEEPLEGAEPHLGERQPLAQEGRLARLAAPGEVVRDLRVFASTRAARGGSQGGS